MKINKFILLKALILIEIPQNLLISLILYLFYNTNLLEKYCHELLQL